MAISVVVPVLNDADALHKLLSCLRQASDGIIGEIVVVDGGSHDGSVQLAEAFGASVHVEAPSRGRQLRTGCERAAGPWLWLLHADSEITAAHTGALGRLTSPGWGRFDIGFTLPHGRYRLLAWLMNHRSRLTGICTGDQGVFLHRSWLERVGGIPDQPLMEDIELSKRLKRLGPPLCMKPPLLTSPRRWERDGFLPTVFSMWFYRAAYFFGVKPSRLVRWYYGAGP